MPTLRNPAAALLAASIVAGCQGTPGPTPPITPGTGSAPRPVNVIAKEWTFVPSAVDLVPGETVVLRLVNGGTEPHEAVFGGPDAQAAWERAHASVAGAPPGPTPVVSVPPGTAGFRLFAGSGQRVDASWTIPPDAPQTPGFVVGCHLPGHFERGMVVPVRWVRPDGTPLESDPSSP